MHADGLVAIDLLPRERLLLDRGLAEWGGPAICTPELAVAMGFTGLSDFFEQTVRLRSALNDGDPLTRQEWSRVLIATEIVFVSDVVGSGVEWPSTTGLSDDETIRLLREVQRKILSATSRAPL